MYAKLVIGGSSITAVSMLRDIARLLTTSNANTSILNGFSQSSSVIYDNTAAGWTYVGGTNTADQPSINTSYTSATTSGQANFNLCLSAPCLSGSALKYAILNPIYTGTGTPYGGNDGIVMTGAQSANSTGIVTNEGTRAYQSSAASAGYDISVNNIYAGFSNAASRIFYLIANARHITIINETYGIMGIWESSMTNAHTFYGTAPFVQYIQVTNGNQNGACSYLNTPVGPTSTPVSTVTPVANYSIFANAFNVTNATTGVNTGVLELGQQGQSSTFTATNYFSLIQGGSGVNSRTNTVDSSGITKYIINPVYYNMNYLGYPTQYITGIVPIYWTRGGIATTGDTVDVSGDTYTYFNCTSNRFAVIMKTT